MTNNLTLFEPVQHYDAAAAFDEFWELYPRKRGAKTKCRAKYIKQINTAEKHTALIDALLRQIDAGMLVKGAMYTPYATSWFNGELWNDEIEVKQIEINNRPNNKLSAVERIQQAADEHSGFSGNVYDQ